MDGIKTLTTIQKKLWSLLRPKAGAKAGYGLVLLIVFVSSAILLATSLTLTLAPSTAQFLSTNISYATAKQVASIGLDSAQSDILTKLGNGTTVDTSYRYPSSGTTSVTAPSYPSSGGTTTVGNYYVTVTKTRGNAYILQVVATANNSTYTSTRLMTLSNPFSIMNSALAIYSLRKTRTSYAGSAVNVRCASTSTTEDIGFTGSGDFDLTTLASCLGDSTLPLDVTTGEKLAYGVRKLSSSYNGYALKVRRSSDNSTQDIGFDTNGNLDTVSLKTFVGSNSGYAATWYDQSGSGKDLTQATTTKQPRIVNAGVIDLKNGVPSLYFDGVDDSMSNTALAGTLITGSELRAFIVSSTESGGSNPSWGEFAVLWKSGDSDAYSTTTSIELLSLVGSSAKTGTQLNGGSAAGNGLSTGVLYQHTAYHAASNSLLLYRNGTQIGSDSVASAFAPTSVILGTSAGSDASTNGRGYFDEFIVFNSALSTANRQSIERSQGHYFAISGMTDGFVTTWYDQSGNGRNATQATAANQPFITYIGTISTNGTIKPGIRFDGSNDYLATATSTAWPSSSNDRALNAVYKLNNAGSNSVVMGWGTIGSGTYSSLFHDLTIGFWGFNADVKSGVTSDINYGHRITANKSGTTLTLYRDGSSAASGTPTLNTTSNTSLTIGESSDGSNFINGNIGEITLFNIGLSSTQLTQLETSQNGYYGQ